MNKDVKELLKKVGEITSIDYFWDNDMNDSDRLFVALEDMVLEYKEKLIEFDDYKQEVEDTTRPLTMQEYTGSAAYRGC